MTCCQSAPNPSPATAGHLSQFAWFRIGLLILLGGLSMYLSLAINISPSDSLARHTIHTLLATASGLALIAGGIPILRNSLVRRITLEQLFLIGLVGSYAASLFSSFTGTGHIYYEVVIILLAIYHLGQTITRFQTRRLGRLEEEIPGLTGQARIVSCEDFSEIPVAQVTSGQLLEVRPGEVIPADGEIQVGSAFVEQLAHTGEPFPKSLNPGDAVLAGFRVLDGTIRIRATASGTARELDRLLDACETSGSTPAESLAQAVLRFFVPGVLAIAGLTVLGWWLLSDDPARALFNGLAVTIVACPCGLGLAIPLATRRSLTHLRMLGFVPHAPDFLARLAEVDAVAFDKTGTLASSQLTLKNIEIRPGTPEQILSWIAAIQRHFPHPVARPFYTIAQPADLENLSVTPIPGRGIEAHFSDGTTTRHLTICNHLQLSETQIAGKESETTHPSASADRTLFFILNGQPVGRAELNELSREGALEAIDATLAAGFPTEILTGDATVADAFSSRIPALTGLSTTQKARHVSGKRAQGHKTLVIGDGLNDTEAMRAAHASIALGTESRAASAVATATLTHNDLRTIPRALALARITKTTLTRLLTLTLIYNFIGITLAAAGLLHPVTAAILMLASSATVLAFAQQKLSIPEKSFDLD